jgi:hypothetical protein
MKSRMAEIKNRPEIFGRQLFFNAADDILGEYGDLLLAPTDVGTYQLVELVEDLCGICYPAHIDRASNSVISNLGIFPDDLGVGLVEFSLRADPEKFFADNNRLFGKKYPYVQSSDAHRLVDIPERSRFLEFDRKPDAEAFIGRLRGFS